MFSSVGRITPKLSSARTVIVKALCVAAMMVAISLLIGVLLPIIWPFFLWCAIQIVFFRWMVIVICCM